MNRDRRDPWDHCDPLWPESERAIAATLDVHDVRRCAALGVRPSAFVRMRDRDAKPTNDDDDDTEPTPPRAA